MLPSPMALAVSWAEHGHICLMCCSLQRKLHPNYPHLISCKEGLSTPSGQTRMLGLGDPLAGLVRAEPRCGSHPRFLAPTAGSPCKLRILRAPALLTTPRQPFQHQALACHRSSSVRVKAAPWARPASPFQNHTAHGQGPLRQSLKTALMTSSSIPSPT